MADFGIARTRDRVQKLPMIKALFPVMLVWSAIAAAQSTPRQSIPLQPVPSGDWEIRSKVLDLAVPGIPGFVVRMVKGKSRAERKRIAAGQGVDALLAPDPKAQCRIDSQRIADGRYAQTLSCPQKRGEPMRISRTGTYDATGFVGQATVSGTTSKGAVRIILDQRASQVGKRAR